MWLLFQFRLSDLHLPRAVQLFFALMLLTTIVSAAGTDDKPLQLILYTPLNVDGGVTTASTTLQLFNPKEAPQECRLAIENAVSTNISKAAGWVIAFYGADNKPSGPILEATIGARKSLAVRVDLSHVVEAGETRADLTCNNVKIADLTLVKDQGLPFRVSLEGNPAEKPEIEFVKGTSLDLRWKNDDAMHYPLAWEFFLKGRSVSGTTTAGPNGSTRFSVTPDADWFSCYQSLFKSETVDGTVSVGYKPQGAVGAYPSKTIPIKAKLSYMDPAVRDAVAMFAVVVILALGGLASVYVNVDLANRVRAISIDKRLGQLARKIGEIGPQLNSQLRVSLFLERGRIEATLPHRVLFTPETAAVLMQSDTDTEALKVRVDWATQISDAAFRLDHAPELTPSLAEKVNKDLSAAQDLLKKSVLSAAELQRVQSLVGGATNILERVGQADEDLEKTIAARIEDLKARFDSNFLATATCITIKAAAPIPFGPLAAGAAQLGPQGDRDANTRKLAVIYDMVQNQWTQQEILDCLRRQDFGSVPIAEQLLAELKERVSLNDLRTEITADPPKVYITTDRDTVRVNTPILMKLMFNTGRYNRVAARRRIECTWSFDHGNLTEKGWEISHYFPVQKDYNVKVTFTDVDKTEIKPVKAIELKVSVLPQRAERNDHNTVELQRWAVGFVVALVGLFAGAKEKILSLDTTAAILAVFIIGFGVDFVKNMLAPK
jgi:hypothetical protein